MSIYVKVKPKSKEEKVEKIDDTHYVVYIKEIPEKGKANKAVIKNISNFFHISKTQVKIISGFTSRQKLIRIISF